VSGAFEDRLDQDQRIRLEAVAQAANSLGAPIRPIVDGVKLIERARTIQDYILGDLPGGSSDVDDRA
jgi:hypothetical protein